MFWPVCVRCILQGPFFPPLQDLSDRKLLRRTHLQWVKLSHGKHICGLYRDLYYHHLQLHSCWLTLRQCDYFDTSWALRLIHRMMSDLKDFTWSWPTLKCGSAWTFSTVYTRLFIVLLQKKKEIQPSVFKRPRAVPCCSSRAKSNTSLVDVRPSRPWSLCRFTHHSPSLTRAIKKKLN